ncbi:FkbM family methyltransferase [Bradyrhizobium viridifuturi]|nr:MULTISPECIES: FkbM family methyltransferase [Bradyrhizobium]ERF83103.1 MAG: FkbM family methyltransferase [Bradyrhizobium sp. DFCI-1]MCA3793625.1 FkbM family methyltransferase [Burkholderia sp.]OYU63537.1 MAG: FkbM family methyltransferase [Bradyrhizobium sp. PARBB1]PSO23344.1 FkbM family methyltransferase [Bradyrhizobium sp. MOS004]QRI71434.1 FkbM family methyltransferase [Bradyrhizobium sp. PSBB068]
MSSPSTASAPSLPVSETDPLSTLLAAERLTAVVDIGANPIDVPPYLPLLQKRLCRLFGFEPQPSALAELNAHKSELETYLPHVVGSGEQARLRVCAAPGMTSLLEPDPVMLKHFQGFNEWARIIADSRIATHRLDDIGEIDAMDYLKIDVQGSELAVFQNGRRRLAEAVVIQTEVSFLPLYKKQPVFGEIDLELRSQGFIPHALLAINKRMIWPMRGVNAYEAFNQLLEADAVYVRDFTKADAMSSEQLKHLALVAHHCYGSYDLAAICIQHLLNRDAIIPQAGSRYFELVAAQRAAATAG